MPTINQLPLINEVTGGDNLVLWVPDQGDSRRCPVSTLAEYIQGSSEENNFVQAQPSESIYFSPQGDKSPSWLYTTFPIGGGQGNTVVGASTPTIVDSNFVRNTIFGANIGQQAVSWDRQDAFGQGAMRWTQYGERNTAIGTISMQWAGANLAADPDGKYYTHDLLWNLGTPPSDPAWNPYGLATASATIRTEILNWLSALVWPNQKTDFSKNVAVGRDSMTEFVKGESNTATGYRSLSLLMEGSSNSGYGNNALFKLIFGNNNSAIGNQAGFNIQKGTGNTFVGSGAGFALVEGDENVIIGSNAGFVSSGYYSGSKNVWIGHDAGRNPVGNPSDTLRIQNEQDSVRPPLISGDFVTGRLGVNVVPSSVAGFLDVRDQAGNPGILVTGDTGRRLVLNNTAAVTQIGLNPQFQVIGTAASSSSGAFSRFSDDNGGPRVILTKTRGVTKGSFALVQSGDILGQVTFAGSDSTATHEAGRITTYATGTPATTSIPGRMELAVTPAAGTVPVKTIEFTSTTLGFFGATPAAKPTLPADATDLATVITLTNAIRSALINYGLAN